MELYSTSHFTQIGQEMWDLQLEINLHSDVKYFWPIYTKLMPAGQRFCKELYPIWKVTEGQMGVIST
jgi:hypothetical protein